MNHKTLWEVLRDVTDAVGVKVLADRSGIPGATIYKMQEQEGRPRQFEGPLRLVIAAAELGHPELIEAIAHRAGYGIFPMKESKVHEGEKDSLYLTARTLNDTNGIIQQWVKDLNDGVLDDMELAVFEGEITEAIEHLEALRHHAQARNAADKSKAKVRSIG